MFALKKASLVQDELLADVDERFIQEVQRNKGNINKYKGNYSIIINEKITGKSTSSLSVHTRISFYRANPASDTFNHTKLFDHSGISKSLTAAERNRLGLRADDEHGEGRQAGLNAKEFLGRHFV